MTEAEQSAPINVLRTGVTLSEAGRNGLRRAAQLLCLTVEEVGNRAAVADAIEIVRLSSVVQPIPLASLAVLDAIGLSRYAWEQYQFLDAG
jgi:formamidase